MISADNISVSFGGFVLLDKVSLMINDRDRIGLVGRNGAGKTTLLKILAGKMEPSAGKVVTSSSSTTGYLPQQMKHMDGKTVYEEAMSAFEKVLRIEKKIHSISMELSERTDYESPAYHKLIEDISHANEEFDMLGGHSLHADVEKTLIGLGFRASDMERPTAEFSGGWRMRIELAKILLRKPGFILLDEPTNHLDIESIQWLEEFLMNYPGGVVIISHDRAFLDNVTSRTVEISLGKLTDYKVNYSRYVVLRAERRQQLLATVQNQQKMIKDTEEFIERFRYKASKAVQVQSRIKQLDKVERIEIEEEDDAVMNLRFPPSPRSGSVVVGIKSFSKAYGDHLVLDKVNLSIERGNKVAFVGRNGEGKTTLARAILGELEYQGECRMGHNVSVGYFAQNQDELLDENCTVLETIDRVAVGDIRLKMRDILGAFLFSGEDVDKKVKVLSGGERSRLSLARMLLQSNNLLILDEPTNHLDMRSKDILKKALKDYDGTLILVSHDREFLDGLVDTVYEFKDKKVKQHLGGIYDFLRSRKIESLRELERQSAVAEKNKETVTDSREDYKRRKEYERRLKKAENEVLNLEKEIAGIEEKIADLGKQLANPEGGSDGQMFVAYQKLENFLLERMNLWEESHSRLEALKNERN
jgi:ATP-binding cassette subfamily F protein 3